MDKNDHSNYYRLLIYRGCIWCDVAHRTTITMMKLSPDFHSRTTRTIIAIIIDCWYIEVVYDAMLHTAQQSQWWNFRLISTHELHPIPRPYGRAIGCLSRVKQRKMTTIYRERTVLKTRQNAMGIRSSINVTIHDSLAQSRLIYSRN